MAVESEKEPLIKTKEAWPEKDSGSAGLIEMQDDAGDFDSAVAGMSVKDLFETYCPAPAKDLWKEHSSTILPVVGKAKTFFADNGKAVSIAHGAFCLVYGGCWPTIALILAFVSVVDCASVKKDFKALFSAKGPSAAGATEPLTPETASLHMANIAKFFVMIYAAWISPFVASVILAMAIEPYVTESIESSSQLWGLIYKAVTDKAGISMSKPWFKFAFTQVWRVVLAVLGHFLFPGTFAALFMGLYGMTLMVSKAGQKVQDTLNAQKNIGPGINLKTIILWTITKLFTLWQALNGFEASFMKWFVPIGFLATFKSGAVSPAFWRVAPAKDQ